MEQIKNELPIGSPIRKEISKSPIVVEDIYVGSFQKEGTESAQMRQVITTMSYYPSKKTSNNLQDNLFATEDFGFEEQKFESVENRIAWMDVPVGTKISEVEAKLVSANGACLYRIISNKPILSDNQEYAITKGLKTMEDFAETQVIRYPEGTIKEINGMEADVSGLLVLKNQKVQYRRVFFSAKPKDDIDLRNSNPTDMYLTPELEMELKGASVLTGQKI